MRAAVITGYGGPEVLRVMDVPEPTPGHGEVMVDVVASALNRADLLQRMGLYPGPPMEHEVPGLEFAGRVSALGDGVSRWSEGDTVMGITGGAAHAERLVIHAVHAGASGVGTAAIQLCRRLGAAVVVTASAGKVARCLDLGADRAVDYATEDWVAVVDELTDGRGADVVLDVIGGDYLDRNADALAVGGTIMQVGLMGGGAATFGLGKLLAKRASLVGTTLRARSLDEKVALSRAFEDEVVPGFEDGSLDVVVDRRYRLADIAEGHAYMETNASVGKIVLDIAAG